MRQLTPLDNLLCCADSALRTLFPPQQRPYQRETPAAGLPEPILNSQEKRHVAGLMRVNHAGEVCAQALLQGQAQTARLPEIKAKMAKAADEEVDHLAWCEQRLTELNSQPSVLNPIWYVGSLLIGSIAGILGDRWSLGFVAETEQQVSAHLQKHLQKLPPQDSKTQAILQQMHDDEMQHANMAKQAGATDLPWLIQVLMQTVAKFMTHSSYYI